MSRFVTERCVVVSSGAVLAPTSPGVLGLARALAPYLSLRPEEVTATLERCRVDTASPAAARYDGGSPRGGAVW